MRRYWIEKNQIHQDQVEFKDDQFHHIFQVCRQDVGHHFEVITDDSKAYLIEVIQIQKKSATGRIISERIILPLPKPHIHLALSLPRYAVFDSTLERCVELGVSSILPFVSQYSFIRKIKDLPEGKTSRWEKIITSATQQSGRGELMKIYDLHDWPQMLNLINPNENNWCLFAYEGQTKININERLEDLNKQIMSHKINRPDNIWIIVGSEGGFSTNEVETMQNLGLHPVTLGSQILRVETACLTLVSVLKYEFRLFK